MFTLHLFSIFTLLITALLHPTRAINTSHHTRHARRHAGHASMDATAVHRSPAHIAAYLEGHNVARAAHGVKPLRWSTHFANLAEQWADACNFKHTNGVLSDKPYGENIVAATGPFPVHAAMGTFIEDAANFDRHHPHFTHYTQVLWESTTELGCASSVCKDLLGPSTGPATLYVCLYDPPGNVAGRMRQNLPSVYHLDHS